MSRSWLSRKDFEALVARAVKDLPKDFRRYLDNVEIEVQEEPNMEALEAVGLEPMMRTSCLGCTGDAPSRATPSLIPADNCRIAFTSIAARSCVCARPKKRPPTRCGTPWSTRSATTSGLQTMTCHFKK